MSETVSARVYPGSRGTGTNAASSAEQLVLMTDGVRQTVDG